MNTLTTMRSIKDVRWTIGQSDAGLFVVRFNGEFKAEFDTAGEAHMYRVTQVERQNLLNASLNLT
jgi:hypothetical protein